MMQESWSKTTERGVTEFWPQFHTTFPPLMLKLHDTGGQCNKILPMEGAANTPPHSGLPLCLASALMVSRTIHETIPLTNPFGS